MDTDVLLTEAEAAKRLCAKPQTLNKWRTRKRGPAYIKISGKIRYKASDVQAFIDASRIDPRTQARRGSARGRRGSR